MSTETVQPTAVHLTREQHLKAVYIVGSRKIGNRTVLVMLCSGPDCGGAEMLARPNVADVAAEANGHIDKMESLQSAVPAVPAATDDQEAVEEN